MFLAHFTMILAAYCNLASYGGNIKGVGAASLWYIPGRSPVADTGICRRVPVDRPQACAPVWRREGAPGAKYLPSGPRICRRCSGRRVQAKSRRRRRFRAVLAQRTGSHRQCAARRAPVLGAAGRHQRLRVLDSPGRSATRSVKVEMLP